MFKQKGLGCPVGSVLLGDKELINKALRVKKRCLWRHETSRFICGSRNIIALENHREDCWRNHFESQGK